jgi:hypothetical protein
MSDGKGRHQPKPFPIFEGKNATQREQKKHVVIPSPIENVKKTGLCPKHKIFHGYRIFAKCKLRL